MSLKWAMVFVIAVVLLTAQSPAESVRPALTQNDPYYPNKEMESFMGQDYPGVKTKPTHGKVCKKSPYSKCKPPISD